jgi:hypothetical protein
MIGTRRFSTTTSLLLRSFMFIAMCSLIPISAEAHGTGTHLKAQSGPYVIDVEYEGDQIVQYGLTRFNMALLEGGTTTEIEVPHDALWARIEHDNDILYAGWLYKPEGLQGGFSYTFQEAGDYQMSVRFRNASGTIAEGNIPFSVKGSGISESHIAVFLFGLVFGGMSILFLGKKYMFDHTA